MGDFGGRVQFPDSSPEGGAKRHSHVKFTSVGSMPICRRLGAPQRKSFRWAWLRAHL